MNHYTFALKLISRRFSRLYRFHKRNSRSYVPLSCFDQHQNKLRIPLKNLWDKALLKGVHSFLSRTFAGIAALLFSVLCWGQSSSLLPDLVIVPAGSFTMGCTLGQLPCDANTAPHIVTLDSFLISAHEVTQAQYEAIMGDSPSENGNCPDCPVENITWYDALHYCNLLSLYADLQPCYFSDDRLAEVYSGNGNKVYWNTEATGYRLLTEAEWEYAARSAGVDDFAFAGSSDAFTVAWLDATATIPTGQLAPNALGLYDMSGNAAEWVWDRFAPFPDMEICAPLGPGEGSTRSVRGGSYQSDTLLRLAHRTTAPPETASGQLGFRIGRFSPGMLPPECVLAMIQPFDGATNVPVTTALEWTEVTSATGYLLCLGTFPNGYDLVESEDVGSITTYIPENCLPAESTVYVTIKPYNAAGLVESCTSFSFYTSQGVPNAPTTITGPEIVCSNQNEAYETAEIDGATDYIWTITGGAISSGQGLPEVEVLWMGAEGTLCVATANACGTSDSTCRSVNIQTPLSDLNPPVGPTSICSGDTETYSTIPVSGASAYYWTVDGDTIAEGIDATTIDLFWNGPGGEICVAAANACGSTPFSCTTVDGSSVPAAPPAPNGFQPVCSGALENYATMAVTGAETYSWTVTGGTITAGQGSSAVTVAWSDAGGGLCVTAENNCGSSPVSCTNIAGGVPPLPPAEPFGSSLICLGDTENYAISPVDGAISYIWSINGGTVTAGQGGITVTVSWAAPGGEVCVIAGNDCGASSENCLVVNGQSAPPGPPQPPSGQTQVAPGDAESYSIAPVFGATGYLWTVSGGNIVNGQGTSSISVNWNNAGGQVCVSAENICGPGTPSCLTVTSAPPPPMVLIPGGTFEMGCTAEQTNCQDELPVHTVTLSDFYLGVFEITQDEWESIMGYNPSTFNDCGGTCPVEQISWYETIVYCNSLSIQQGLTPVYIINGSTDPDIWGPPPVFNPSWDAVIANFSANGYRLPTEAEWEYAARAGGGAPQTLFSGSNNLNEVGWWDQNAGGTTHPVGGLQPNAFGLFDMSGNVYEWIWDWYDGNYYANSPPNNPTGPPNGIFRLRRSGSWSDPPAFCRVADRDTSIPGATNAAFGFRIARTP